MMGGRIRRRMTYSSRPSGGLIFLSKLTVAASSNLIDVCLSFAIFLCAVFLEEE